MIDTILKALAPAVPHLIPAAHKGDMGGCSFFGFRDDGSRFLLMNIFGGGWGGRPNEDGEDAAVSVCQGDVRNTPVELQEIKYPVLVETHALRADSGGDGKYPRRARRRADLPAAAEVQGQHQSRPHARSALGPARRQARRGQRMHHPARRRQRDAR